MSYPIMKSSSLIQLSLVLIVLSSSSSSLGNIASSHKHDDFVECLLDHSITNVVYSTPTNNTSAYSSILNFSIRNHRFSTPNTPKPLAIIKPSNVSHIQAAVTCSKSHGLQIRIRSGGHDYEGLSYVAYYDVPYVLLDLIDLNDVTVDAENRTAWVESGATLGELYYKIGEKSGTLAFPGGICPTVGIGGHFSGGGYGMLMRKYGLAADNVIDATLVDANGKYHKDRESMGEDLFWAIRGGGGGSFGVVVAWKIKLVAVPSTLTICSSTTTGTSMEEDAIKLIHEWQYKAHNLDQNLFLAISLIGGKISTERDGKINPTALFFSLFLGEANELMTILNTTFPKLGLSKQDCIQTTWIESVLFAANGFQIGEHIKTLLNRSALIPPTSSGSAKIKTDYVNEPITEAAIKGIWERLKSEDIEAAQAIFIPYGGKMSQISESAIPFPRRAGNLYQIDYIIGWQEQGLDAENRHVNWVRELYGYMTPFVSKSPRAAYVNCRDLDIGTNNKNGRTSYEEAMIWGVKYFGNNFKRLVRVKIEVDSDNFFRHEQSIPTLTTGLEFTKRELNILYSMNMYLNDAPTYYCEIK